MALTLEDIQELMPGAKFYKRGEGKSYLAALCPFHEDRKPSLLVYENDWWFCRACGRAGRFDVLARKLQKVGYVHVQPSWVEDWWTPPRLPRDRWGISDLAWAAHQAVLDQDSLRWYYQWRGVDDMVEPAILGWYKGWATIPLRERNGEVSGLIIRAGQHVEQASGGELRFAHPVGQSIPLYVPVWRMVDAAKTLAVVFGMFDAIALAALGFAVVTNTSGVWSLSPNMLDQFRGKAFVLIPDKTRSELEPVMKFAGRLGPSASLLHLSYPGDLKDPADYLRAGKRKALFRELAGALS